MTEQVRTEQIVGVLNSTPDSFSDGGLYMDPAAAYTQVKKLFANGASIIDIGAEATNPKAKAISASSEWERLEPILTAVKPLLKHLNFSIDTRNAVTVQRVVELMGDTKFYVNDVTTFVNSDMREAVAEYGLWAIASHSPLKAHGNIEEIHRIKMASADEVKNELQTQIDLLIREGVPDDHIVRDPGIGFGKDMRLNWDLLDFARFVPGKPVMIGHSHKRFLMYDPLSSEPSIEESERHVDTVNRKAAKIAIASCYRYNSSLLLRAHEPEWYRDLLAPRADLAKIIS